MMLPNARLTTRPSGYRTAPGASHTFCHTPALLSCRRKLGRMPYIAPTTSPNPGADQYPYGTRQKYSNSFSTFSPRRTVSRGESNNSNFRPGPHQAMPLSPTATPTEESQSIQHPNLRRLVSPTEANNFDPLHSGPVTNKPTVLTPTLKVLNHR